jgi:hypothetical protein
MKSKIIYNDIEFDSEEERLFYLYLEELQNAEYVKIFDFHTKQYVLSEPVKYSYTKKLKTKDIEKEGTLLREHIYTPDYWIDWHLSAYGIFYSYIDGDDLSKTHFVVNKNNEGENIGSLIEVKPSWDAQNMTRLFSINAKWMYQEHHLYVQKVTPIGDHKCLFAKTFVPEKARYTAKTGKLKKYKFKVKTLEEFINEQKQSI